MQVVPILPTERPRYQKRRLRAVISVRHLGGGKTEHAVIDTNTGQKVILPAPEAWALHKSLNLEV